jgi:hypothetical protein
MKNKHAEMAYTDKCHYCGRTTDLGWDEFGEYYVCGTCEDELTSDEDTDDWD